MKVTKGKVWFYSLLTIVGICAAGLYTGIKDHIGPTFAAIVALATTYFGGNVADNGVKGKYYNPALDKSREQEKKGEK